MEKTDSEIDLILEKIIKRCDKESKALNFAYHGLQLISYKRYKNSRMYFKRIKSMIRAIQSEKEYYLGEIKFDQ